MRGMVDVDARHSGLLLDTVDAGSTDVAVAEEVGGLSSGVLRIIAGAFSQSERKIAHKAVLPRPFSTKTRV
jgi:hypothetical protein